MTVTKAQISFEFISVYVWSFIALAVVVAALAYFGVFDSSQYIKEGCESGTQVRCVDAVVMTDGMVAVKVRNDLSQRVNITSFVVKGEEDFADLLDDPLYPGSMMILTVETGLTHTLDEHVTYPFLISYRTASGNEYAITGQFTVVVSAPQGLDLPVCGNGILEGSEQCEPPGAKICPLFDKTCKADCTCPEFIGDEGEGSCGNGIIDGGENCESDEDCVSHGVGYFCSQCRCEN